MSRAEIERDAVAYVRKKAPELLTAPGPFPVLQAWDDLPEDFPDVKSGVEELAPGREGECNPDNSVYITETTFNGLLTKSGRARFTTLHEIYHVIRHRQYIRRALVRGDPNALQRRSEVPLYCDPEWQANEFASLVLMPTAAVKILAEEVPRSQLVDRMVEVFEVSAKAAEARLRKIGR